MAAFDGITSPTITVQFNKSGIWTNVTTTDVLNIDIRRGRARNDQRDNPGKSILIFNNTSGIYDPDNTSVSSPWVVGGASILRDGLQMRIIATWSSVQYILFSGYLETTYVNQGFTPTVTMAFIDGISFIADTQAPALATMSFAETAATRVGRMLDYVGWPAGARSLSGSTNLLSTSQNKSCMEMIYQCADAIAGRFYISRSGVATLVPLADKFSRPTQLLFDDSGAVNTVDYQNLVTNPGTLYVVNSAVIGRAEKLQVTSKYNPSISSYGVATAYIDAPVFSDTSATNLALYESRKNATPTTYVELVEFNAMALGVLYPDFLATELSDQVSVKRTTYDGRPLDMNLVVEGMAHKITMDNWTVVYNTSTINPYSITI